MSKTSIPMQNHKKNLVVMGIDPGSVRAGYGILKKEGHKLVHLENGLIKIRKSGDNGEKLCSLEKELKILISKYSPDIVGLEKLFASKNLKTVIEVAEARGVIRKVVSESGIKLKELAPQTVKMSVTGSGRADKKSVSKMVGLMLNIETRFIIDDATDALAIAIASSDEI